MASYFSEDHFNSYRITDSVRSVLNESRSFSYTNKTTVFISHKHDDLKIIQGFLGFLKNMDVVTYIDAFDPTMPDYTCGKTAERIKERIKQCDKFIYRYAMTDSVKKVIMLSTDQVYQFPKTREPIREDSDLKPITNYAVMKYSENSVKNDMDLNKRIKWNLPWVTLYDEEDNPTECLMLKDRDITFVFKGEEVPSKTASTIIMPKEKKFITN